jgi:hypothetical protein
MLTLLSYQVELSVVRMDPKTPVPPWSFLEGRFLSVSRSDEELSIVCESKLVPQGLQEERGWYYFKIQGPIPFGLTGVLSAVLVPLADAKIGIFALSTYDTDYILVKMSDFQAAKQALLDAGHSVFS